MTTSVFHAGPKARFITAWGAAPGKHRKQKLEGLKARTIDSAETVTMPQDWADLSSNDRLRSVPRVVTNGAGFQPFAFADRNDFLGRCPRLL